MFRKMLFLFLMLNPPSLLGMVEEQNNIELQIQNEEEHLLQKDKKNTSARLLCCTKWTARIFCELAPYGMGLSLVLFANDMGAGPACMEYKQQQCAPAAATCYGNVEAKAAIPEENGAVLIFGKLAYDCHRFLRWSKKNNAG